jgi:hypothetical protein
VQLYCERRRNYNAGCKNAIIEQNSIFRRKQHSTISEQILSDENAVFATPKSRQKKT